MRHIANLKVKDLMRKLKTVHESTKISELIRVFEDDNTDAVAVVDSKGSFIGDIHQQDLLKLLLDPKDASWEEVTGIFGREVDLGYFAETARDLMHKHEIEVTPETTVREVVSLMFKHNLDVLPVVSKESKGTIFSKEGKYIGMVTEMEILDKMFEHNRKRRKK